MSTAKEKLYALIARAAENAHRARLGMPPVGDGTAAALERLRKKYPGEEDQEWLEGSFREMAQEDRKLDKQAEQLTRQAAKARNN